MKVLLLSAYDAQSHRYWRDRLTSSMPDVDWVIMTLPPRYFSWRIRGNALTWGVESSSAFDQGFDLCLVTSMVDLATLRGLVPALARVPTILYFHENQFEYPAATRQHAATGIDSQMVQLYSALCADRLVFNSEYNEVSFFAGLSALLQKLPDHVPVGICPGLSQKSSVLPVPIMAPKLTNATKVPNTIVWNHRWEYDKAPARLLAFINAMPRELSLTFHVVGQQFRQVPEEFLAIKSVLRERRWLGHWGYIDDSSAYHALLEQSRIVISTAEHDFQGIAVLEAAAAGCFPLLPNRLAYPYIFPPYCLYDTDSDIAREAENMVEKARELLSYDGKLPCPDITSYVGESVLSRYRVLFEDTLRPQP